MIFSIDKSAGYLEKSGLCAFERLRKEKGGFTSTSTPGLSGASITMRALLRIAQFVTNTQQEVWNWEHLGYVCAPTFLFFIFFFF